jgi:prepilin-type N-terminal cleavage/methylation domain-containing protein
MANGGREIGAVIGAAVIRHPGQTSPPPLRPPQTAPGRPTGAPRPPAPRAFTLIELLVVIGIVALLAAILLPVLGRARATSHNVGCLSNLRQIMTGFQLYADRHNHHLPDPLAAQESWESLLRPYVQSRDIYHCQADGGLFLNLRSSYDWRDTPNPLTSVAGKTMNQVRRASTVFAFDALPDWHAKGMINAARIDGSVQSMTYQDCLKDLDHPIGF